MFTIRNKKIKILPKKITKYWHNVRISEIGDIRFSRNFFPRRFPPFRTCTRNKLSLTCRQSLDHVTVTFLDALHKSAFFHQSFGRTLENTFASEKYKTLYISSISQGFPFSPLRVVVPSARIHALHTRCGGDGTGSRIIFSIRALRKIEFTQVGIRPWARMTIFSVIERREMLRELRSIIFLDSYILRCRSSELYNYLNRTMNINKCKEKRKKD